MAINIIPVRDTGDEFKQHIEHRLRELETSLKPLHTTALPNWRRAYEAQPLEKIREFPFHNASNLIVPIIGIHTDTLLARVMSAMFKTQPIWVTRMLGDHPDVPDTIREALEEFLGAMAVEPTELDLMRVYEQWVRSVVCYGTSVIKSPWIKDTIYNPQSGFDNHIDWMPHTRYEGPRPEAVPFEDMWIPLGAKTLETANFISHRRRMLRHEIQDLKALDFIDKAALDSILSHPDRTTPFITQQTAQADLGAQQGHGHGYEEFDIHECWFDYRGAYDRKARVIAYYHLGTKTLAGAIYDTYPALPFVAGRLFLRDNIFYAYGFAEKLGQFQEEVSIMHNQRRDAVTVSEMCVWRVDPDSPLHAGYKLYPSAMVPGKKDEIEPMRMGEPGGISIDEEHLTLDLAERDSGVHPPMQGSGSGFNTKRGVYTAMGTLSLLQEGNTRTDLNVSDIRYAHTKLARVISQEYANFGNEGDQRFRQFGQKAQLIWAALQALVNNKIALPINPSTASLNREVEKQNDIMLSKIAGAHYGQITQMLTSLASPQVPPPIKEYVAGAIKAANKLMTAVFRHFDYDEPHNYVPEVNVEALIGESQGGAGQPGGGQGMAPGNAQPPQGVPGGGMGVPPQGAPGQAGAGGTVPGAGVPQGPGLIQ